jgi:predicted transcriptional regulator
MDSKIYYLLYHTIPYFVESVNLGEKPNNKKEQILHLLAERKLSVKEIAKIVHTTEANVYKEKSKARGLFIRRKTRSDEMVLVAAESGTSSLPSRRLKPEANHYQYLNIPDLDREGIKKLYTEFKDGKKPADIIADHGFHPEVVEKEYQRFMIMNERDIDVFQNKILSDLIKHPSKNTKPLLEKYKTTGFLTHYELFELITLKVKDDTEREIGFWSQSSLPENKF